MVIPGDNIGHHRRGHSGRGNAIYPHPKATHFCRQVSRHPHHRVFRGRVGMRPQSTHHAGRARHTDDRPRSRLFHVPAGMLHTIKNAVDHDVDGELPFICRGGGHGPHGAHDTGTVKHDVDLAEL